MPHLRAPWRSALLQKIAIIGMSDATLYNPWPLRRCCSRILLAGAPLGATGLYPLHGQGGTYGSHRAAAPTCAFGTTPHGSGYESVPAFPASYCHQLG